MKRIIRLLIILMAMGPVSAQNIVFNGSFEIYQTCPKYQSQIKLAAGWDRPTDGTPDYFNECCGTSKIGVPDNFMGSQKPRTGKCYAGLYLYQSDAPDSYREYLTNELKSTLQKGKVYYVKFYVYLGKLSECAVGNIGVLFTEEFTKTGNAARLEQKPQLSYSGKIISDSGRWVELLWTYKAKGTEKYMTIGNFTPAEKCNVKFLVTPTKDASLKSYYYIDDVCVEEVIDGQPCRCIQDSNSFAPQAAKMKITRDSSVAVKAPIEITLKPEKNFVLKNIAFEPDKTDLLPGSYKELENIAEYMYKNYYTTIEFNGYTDNPGIDKVNLDLSKGRAKAVADYLFYTLGIDSSRIKFKGHGCENAIANNLSPEGRDKNKRIEFKLHKMKGIHVDSIYKKSMLKGGYTLAYKRHDNLNYLCLIKGYKETEVSEHESADTMPLNVLGYLYTDYDSIMVIATHLEANPIKIEVINKRTGGTIMYGTTPFYLDTVKHIMMFEGSYRRGGKLILYHFDNGKTELFQAPRETPCFCCFCWKVLSLTDTEIKIEYLDANYQTAVKVYQRK